MFEEIIEVIKDKEYSQLLKRITLLGLIGILGGFAFNHFIEKQTHASKVVSVDSEGEYLSPEEDSDEEEYYEEDDSTEDDYSEDQSSDSTEDDSDQYYYETNFEYDKESNTMKEVTRKYDIYTNKEIVEPKETTDQKIEKLTNKVKALENQLRRQNPKIYNSLGEEVGND